MGVNQVSVQVYIVALMFISHGDEFSAILSGDLRLAYVKLPHVVA